MTGFGSVIVLNGPPRSGKSSIAAAIQSGPGAWMNLGVDLVRMATPPMLQPGIGLRPGGERPDLEDFVVASYLALYDSVRAHAMGAQRHRRRRSSRLVLAAPSDTRESGAIASRDGGDLRWREVPD